MTSREEQYAEERAEVEVLFAKAKKHAELGKQIQASLTRMRERDGFWQQARTSIYNDTSSSRVVNRNIDAIKVAIQRARQPLEGRADEERVIREGPQASGTRNYLASLKRVQKKHAELLNAPMRVNMEAAQDLGQLLGQGEEQVLALFTQLAKQDVTPLEPLRYITKSEPFPVIPEQRAQEMAELNSFFGASHLRNGPRPSQAVQIYADSRGAYLQASLQNLALATITTSRNSKPDEIYRAGSSGIGVYATAMEQMMAAEWASIGAIFLREERGLVLAMTCDRAVRELEKTLAEVAAQTRPAMTTAGFIAFELIDVVSKLAYNLDAMSAELKGRVLDALRAVRDAAKLVVKELIEDIRRRLSAIMMLPKNSAAIPFTSEVMRRLQALVAYPQSFSSVLTSIGDKNWLFLGDNNNPGGSNAPNNNPVLAKTFDVGPDGTRLMANYCLDTIEVLSDLLEGKGRSLSKDKPAFGLFLANNVSVIESSIRQSELSQILPAASRNNKLDMWRKRGVGSYVDAWRDPCKALMEVQSTKDPGVGGGGKGPGGRPTSGGPGGVDSQTIVKALSSKDKDAIKKKFDHFNIVFRDLVAKHREFMPAMQPDVKAQLADDIRTMIQPLYGRFLDRYEAIDKGKGKHVQFNKQALAAELQSLA